MDLNNLPTGTPVWVTIGGAVIILALSITERAAKLKGPLGALGRWWNERQIREVRRKKSLDETIDSLVDQRMGNRIQDLTNDLEALKTQVGELRKDLERERREHREERERLLVDHAAELEKVRERERLQHRYIVLMTRALRGIEIWAADLGLALPPPPLQTFPEWLAEQDVQATARNPPDE